MVPLFTADRLPHKPYCSNNKTASNILPLEAALQYSHVQFNPPHLKTWLVFDLDFGGGTVPVERALLHYEDMLCPPPNIIVINPVTGHAHYFYALKTPVARGENARLGPLQYSDAVYRGLGAMLNADHRYAQLLARNPLHPGHITFIPCCEPYELSELDEYIANRKAGRLWQKGAQEAGLEVNDEGRNCTVFDSVRKWSYQWVNEYRSAGSGFDAFAAACLKQAETVSNFPGHSKGPLNYSEVKAIARSVARWTWRHYDGCNGSDPTFSSKQAARGRKTGAKRRDLLLPRALELAAQGCSLRSIGLELGVDHKTVGAWLKRSSP